MRFANASAIAIDAAPLKKCISALRITLQDINYFPRMDIYPATLFIGHHVI